MTPICRLLIPLAVLFATLSTRAAEPSKDVDFAHDVVPILKAHCAKCHTNGTYKGSISFDTRAEIVKKAIKPGKAGESELIKRITSRDKDERMPPEGAALTDKQIGILRDWIDQGANWEMGFSFKPRSYVASIKPRRPDIPPANVGRNHPVIAFSASI